MKSAAKLRWVDPRRSFTTKLALAMAALLIVTLAGATFITIHTVRSRLTDQVGENFEAQAGSISQVIEGFFLEKVGQLEVLALSDAVEEAVAERNATYTGSEEESLTQIQSLDADWVAAGDGDPFVASITDPTRNPTAHQLADFLENFGDHAEVFVTDRYGATVAATGRLSDYYQADEGWWQAGWNDGAGAVYISNPEFDESAGITALLIAVPIVSDESGEVIGVLRSTLNMDGLLELVAGTTLGETGHAMLFDASGQVLVDPRAGDGEGSIALPADIRQKFVAAVSGFQTGSEENGKKWILGHSVIRPTEAEDGGQRLENQTRAAVANLGWLAIVRQEADEALTTVDAIVNGAIVVGLGALALASLVVLFVARAISRPMVALGRAAEAIGAGNLDTPLPPAGADEIGRLTTSFANMNARLRHLIGSLQSRTAELSRANEQLEREIAERRLAEEALAAKTKEYIDTLNLTVDIIIRLDKDGRFIFLNDSACQSFGESREELLGSEAATFVHPEDIDRATQAFRGARENKGPVKTFESRLATPMGTRVLEWNGHPLFDEEGQYAGIQITARDITERKQMEEALRETDARYRLIAENTRDLIWIMDLSLKYTYMSPGVTRMRGYTVEEIMASTAAETMTPASFEVARKALAEEIAIEQMEDKDMQRSRKLELEMYCKDGSTIWTEMNMAFLRDQDAKPIGILGITRDISDRKKAEEALRESEERYRRLIEDSIDGIVVSEGATIRFVNRAALKMFGYDSEEEVLCRPITDFLSPEYRKLMGERNAARERGKPVPDRYEFKAVRKDGSEFPAEISIGLVSHQGKSLTQSIIRDMTERKRAEEELRTKDSAIESSINAIALADLGGNLTYVNTSFLRMWGYDDATEVLGRRGEEFLRLEEKTPELAKALQDRGNWIGELIAVRKDGSTFDVQVSLSMVTDEVGKPICIMGSSMDITERKQMEEALQDSEERYRLIAENAEDVIWTTDLSLRYTYVSLSVTRLRGYTPEEVVGKPVAESLTPASLKIASKVVAQEMAIERMEHKDLFRSRTLELEMYCKDGSTVWAEVNVTILRDQDGKPVGVLGVTRDISERKRVEEERERLNAELEVRAITDSLTGLYDHAHFYQRLSEEIDRCKRYKHGFAVVMMDVNNFKQYNDSRGHQAGDEALRLIAECIRTSLRRSDLAFRYGGDEFAAILPHAGSSKARAVVERINGRIAKALQKMDGGARARLSLSCGVACFPDDGTIADDLVRIADSALYSAKWVARARDIMGQKEDIQSLISALVGRRTGVEDAVVGETFLRPEALHEHQARIVASVASSIAVALKDAGVTQALEDPDLQVVATVGAAAEIKDRYIRGHPERTSEWSAALAQEMGLSAERVRDIRIAGLLHDIGKVTVSEAILNKPGRLTKQEFASIKDHPIVGATLVSQVKGFERLVPIVRHHHERCDGKGYPDGLAGEGIPLEARILSVVDSFDAMIHERAYRQALAREEAIAELERGAGSQFDPEVVKAFVGLVERQDGELAAPAEAASEDKQLAALKPSAPRKP